MTDTTQQPQQPAAPTPGTPEHDTAMASKFDAAQQKPQAPADPPAPRVAGLPEKFASVEAMAKAYAELEKKLGTPPAAPPADPNATAGKLDFKAVSEEFAEKGELSAETYAALEKQGVTKDLADSFIAGQKAAGAAREAVVFAEAGGEDSYRKMVEWGAANFAPEEVELFNMALAGSQAAAKMAVAGLKQRYEASAGKPPNLLDGGASREAVGYESLAQMKADMKDPRYKSDPAFRAKVSAKLAQSTAF